MIELQYSTRTNCVFDLKNIIKMQYTQKQIAKKMHMSTRQLQNLIYNQDQIPIDKLQEILLHCGYKLELSIIKE